MSRHSSTSFTAMALAIGLVLHGTAVAQDHSGHVMPTPAAQEQPQPSPTQPSTSDTHHAGHTGHAADKPKPAEQPAADQAQMDHSQMDHSAMGHDSMAQDDKAHAGMDHGKPTPDKPITPIPVVTDADRAAAFPTLTRHMEHAKELNSYLLFDRLEAWDADHGTGQAWEAQGWLGSDLNRVWLRSEGEREGGHTEAADLEVLYGRSVSPWWDVVVGIKHDFKPGDSQSWAAFGVQGLSPYKFEVEATAYVGESGQTAARIEAEYELLLTNRLILQPLVEVSLFGKDDPERGVGSGLSTAEAGLRLRYEFNRRFAPYIGVVHERAFGGTADFHRAEGEDTQDTRVVAGVRIWF